jgi:hypothetical protein
MYVMDQPLKWEYCIHLVEFAYNNGNHASIKMSSFEALYGRKCNTPVSWDNPIDKVVIEIDFFVGNGREYDKDQVEFKGYLG